MFPLWYLTSWVVFFFLRFWVIFVWKIIPISWMCKSKFKFFICPNIFLHLKYFRFQMFKINFFLHLHIFYSFSYFVSNSKNLWLPFCKNKLFLDHQQTVVSSSISSFKFRFCLVFLFDDFALLRCPFLGIGLVVI